MPVTPPSADPGPAVAAPVARSRAAFPWPLAGFLLLGFGAIGFMRDTQPLIRRIVGAVVVTAQMLLVFATMIAGCGRVPGG